MTTTLIPAYNATKSLISKSQSKGQSFSEFCELYHNVYKTSKGPNKERQMIDLLICAVAEIIVAEDNNCLCQDCLENQARQAKN